jgi:hypothetical protein
MSPLQIEISCLAYVGDASPIACTALDDAVCDVEVQYIVVLTNSASAVPTIIPSAAPSTEPSRTAAPTGSKKGKGKTSEDGKGKKAKDAKEGKGKDFNDFPASPGTIVLDEGHEVFMRMGSGASCGIDKVELDVEGVRIPPGGTPFMLSSDKFAINVCECHSWMYMLGIVGVDDSLSSGKGKGKSGGACFVSEFDQIMVMKLPSEFPSAEPSPEPSDPPSMEPTVSAPPSEFPTESPSAQPSVSMAPTCKGKRCKGTKA